MGFLELNDGRLMYTISIFNSAVVLEQLTEF